MTIFDRLQSKTVINENGCWIWTGRKNDKGYGRIYAFGFDQEVHKVGFKLFNFIFDSSLNVNHHCDVRECWNPSHLYRGTQADNMRDRSLRGRCVNANKIYCSRGHKLEGNNLYIDRNGKRDCRYCRNNIRESKRIWKRRALKRKKQCNNS